MEDKVKASGLTWPRGKPIWRASRPAIKAGFSPKWVNLQHLADNEPALAAGCQRLRAEELAWLSGRYSNAPVFDGTVGSLVRFYQVEPSSRYHKLEPAARHPYDVYARMLCATVGARRIDALDGRDLQRWYTEWSAPRVPGGKPRIAAARMAFVVLKAALSFGISCRLPGCADLKLILQQQRFPASRPRSEAPTAAEIVAARKAAHDLGHPLVALAYALQFEGAIRQWDVIGKWLPLAYPTPSSVIDRGMKWLGPTWAQIDSNLIFRLTPSKTQFTTAATVTLDLRVCPMVVEELARIPVAARSGPLIVNSSSGMPYLQAAYRHVWRKVAAKAGIRRAMLSRDLRAGAVTEGRQAGAPLDDLAKNAGHASKRTTRIYDREQVEAHRRVMQARKAYRAKGDRE